MSPEVDIDHRFESVGAEIADRGGEVSGGIVDDNVELAELRQQVLDHSGHLIVAAHVADAVDGLNPRLL